MKCVTVEALRVQRSATFSAPVNSQQSRRVFFSATAILFLLDRSSILKFAILEAQLAIN